MPQGQNPVKSKYKIWDANFDNGDNTYGAWVEYFFRTTADQVGEIYDSSNASNSLAFISNRVSIKSGSNHTVPFAVSWDSTNNKTLASVTITGADLVGGAVAVSGSSLVNIAATDEISVALGKLDKGVEDAKAAVPSGVLTTSNFGDNDKYPDLAAIEAVSTTGFLKRTGSNTWSAGNLTTSDIPDLSATYLPLTAGSGKALTGDLYLGGHNINGVSIVDAVSYRFTSGREHDWNLSMSGDGYDNPVIEFGIENGSDYYKFILDATDGDEGTIATRNWVTSQIGNLGTAATKNYTTNVINGSSDLVTSGAVYSAIAALPTPMQFKGTIGTNGTQAWSTLPSASSTNSGWTYKVITAHGASAPVCAVGDTIISNGTEWVVIPSGDEPGGTVTNVATGNGLTGGPITSSGTISLATAYGDTVNPYGSKTAHYVLAAPANAAGTPSFRALVAGDIPDLSGTYLPLTAGSSKALSGDLYLGSHSIKRANVIEADVVEANGYHFTSGQEQDWALSMSGLGNDHPIIMFEIDGGSTTYNFYLDGSEGYDGDIATQSWVRYQIGNYQPLDADLTAIAAISTTGYLKRTGSNTWSVGNVLMSEVTAGSSYPLSDSLYFGSGNTLNGCVGALNGQLMLTSSGSDSFYFQSNNYDVILNLTSDHAYNLPDDAEASGQTSLTLATREWVGSNTVKMTIATTAPSNPSTGNIWIDTSSN